MKLTPSDIYTHRRPSECELRVYLKANGASSGKPSPYAEVLERLGQRHEQSHLKTFTAFEDLSGIGSYDEVFERTKVCVANHTPVIYQALLKCNLRIAGVDCEISGRPDFLIKDEIGYRIRDSKISRRITQKDHPEIILQLQTYGWLFERVFGVPASRLEVHNGPGAIVEVPFDGPDPVINALREIVQIRLMTEEPFSPVGLSKCGACGYRDICWEKAEVNRSVALVAGVDQGLAITLHEMDILTMDQLLEKFNEESLGELKRQKRASLVRVGSSAYSILRNARALASGEERLLSKPDIPVAKNYVMFDLEGLPPQLDELQKVYLWGMQVFGETPGAYISSTAGFGIDGDRQGWEEFLTKASEIFDTYGDIPFVHWANYEATLISVYLDRFGDETGRAARVQENLLNLLQMTENSIVLPLPGCSGFSKKAMRRTRLFIERQLRPLASSARTRYRIVTLWGLRAQG